MKQQYANPFDRYSSRTKRLNYYLPFYERDVLRISKIFMKLLLEEKIFCTG